MGCAIIGCGKALPALDVDNNALAQLVDTSDEWITARTGIKSRRIAVSETNADLGEIAARQALGWDKGGFCEESVDAETIDLVICATLTPDSLTPSNAGILRRRLGLKNAIAFDMNAACSGFVYGLTVAESLMAASAPGVNLAETRNPIRRALIVGTERLSRVTDWNDRTTCVLFGDGAGAAVVEWDANRTGIMGSFITNEDDATNALTLPACYHSPFPFDNTGVAGFANTNDPSMDAIDAELSLNKQINESHPRSSLYMNGQKVFKFAAEAMSHAVDSALQRAGLTLDDVALVVPHQANERIIKYAAKKMNRPLDFFQISIAHRGNSSAACVPMTLADAYENGRIKRSDKVVLVAFGGGFTSGAIVYEA